MAGALLVDMSLPVSDGAAIATSSAKRDGENRATEKSSLCSRHSRPGPRSRPSCAGHTSRAVGRHWARRLRTWIVILCDAVSTFVCTCLDPSTCTPTALTTTAQPLLHIGSEHRAYSPTALRNLLVNALTATGLTDAGGEPLVFSRHDFRRIFVTDAVMNGLRPHIAQVTCGHRTLDTTMGYKATYPAETFDAHHAFITRRRATRPSDEYPTPSPGGTTATRGSSPPGCPPSKPASRPSPCGTPASRSPRMGTRASPSAAARPAGIGGRRSAPGTACVVTAANSPLLACKGDQHGTPTSVTGDAAGAGENEEAPAVQRDLTAGMLPPADSVQPFL